jgi:hypothetical protein
MGKRQVGKEVSSVPTPLASASMSLPYCSLTSTSPRHFGSSRLPRQALSLYTELVEHAIAGRGRRTYQQAVHYLKRLKAVYQSLEVQSDCEAYLQLLRAQYRHLPALQDEMHQARL